MKKPSIISSFGLAEDGHPCESALEFRRIAIRNQIIEDVSVNGLDLAISFAWIGKAISRTVKLDAWKQTSVDPNTWEFVRAMALDLEVRRYALNDALSADALPNFAKALDHLRRSSSFLTAVTATQSTITATTSHSDVLFWIGELQHIAKNIEGPKIRLNIARADNLVSLASFRKAKEDAR